MELGRRKILHVNVTDHPSAEWTKQQLREALPGDHPFRFLIHDRDSIFSQELDRAVATMGVRVLRAPPQAPQANSFCERIVGTIRRECLDFLIPLGQRHLKDILNRWVLHYNHGRVHMSLGPGIPASLFPSPPQIEHRHQLPQDHRVRSKAVLGGLHHEYWLERSPHEHARHYCAPQVYAARKSVVEPVFGLIKQARGFRQFLLRGLKKIAGEWALVCMTHNILRIYAVLQA